MVPLSSFEGDDDDDDDDDDDWWWRGPREKGASRE
jgi:hypothetical protein